MNRQLKREQEFLLGYERGNDSHAKQAEALEALVSEVLERRGLEIHAITARAKTAHSIRAKLLRRAYRRPNLQLMDRLGARVILYHGNTVTSAVDELRKQLRIYNQHSSDKRTALGLREFGYRSYHLVASLRKGSVLATNYKNLVGARFEIQVRSILEHAWAEIEHETIYKADARFPNIVRRRFAAVAGVLELLESEFQNLRHSATGLIDDALVELKTGSKRRIVLDVPHLLAALEWYWPKGLSFRTAEQRGTPFPTRIESRFLLALSRIGLRTVQDLRSALRRGALRTRAMRYAMGSGILVDQVSHLAVLALLLGERDPQLLQMYFPEFGADRVLWAALGR